MELAEALEAVGIHAGPVDGVLLVDGSRVPLAVVERSHPTPADLAELVASFPDRRPVVVVADRISGAGRDELRRSGWGWLDRRGHLRIWAPGVRVESPLPRGDDARGDRPTNPWTPVGFEVALASLLRPDRPVTARSLAPVIGRSVGAVQEMVARLRAVGLVGNTTQLPLLPELFWETAAHWPDDRWTPLSAPLEAVAERLGDLPVVRVDDRAATLGGARMTAVADAVPRVYVADAASLRRVRGLVEPGAPVRCWVRISPVVWLPTNADHPRSPAQPWEVAHPMVCALRLAADPSRGREIVESWGIVPVPAPGP